MIISREPKRDAHLRSDDFFDVAHRRFERSEFGLTWNAALDAAGVMVSDDVKLSFDVQLTKQAQLI